ncbi:hypothetical protein ABK040_003617 [Willaertia magna]
MNCLLFEYSDKTKSISTNNFNENHNQTTFINHNEKIHKIFWEFSNLLHITKNNNLYRIGLDENKSSLLDENVISVISCYENCNYLKKDKVIFNKSSINLPQLDLNDKIIDFTSLGSSSCCFLLTEMGKVFIYGRNDYGVLGFTSQINKGQQLDHFVKHTELEEKMKSKIIEIKCGYNFCVIRCENGNSYGSGYNYYKDMGNTENNELHEFTLLKDKVKQYGCGHFSCAFLTFDGDVYVCGKQGE